MQFAPTQSRITTTSSVRPLSPVRFGLSTLLVLASGFACTNQPGTGPDAEPEGLPSAREPNPPAPESPSPESPSPDATPESEPGVAPCAEAGRMDELVTRLSAETLSQGIPGAAVAIACADGTIVARGFGTRSVNGEPVDGETYFQLASVSKALTGATGVLLDVDGTIDLDAALTQQLAGVNVQAPFDTPMTLRHLLSHSAGFTTEGLSGGPDLEGLFSQHPSLPLWAPPGRVFNYSNYGYALAGLALQRAAGEAFADVVTTRLLAPHQLDLSFDASAVEAGGNYASGHTGSPSAPTVYRPTEHYYGEAWYGPMGGAFGSAQGLASFAALLLRDDADALAADRAALQATMTTREIRTDYGPATSYGLGLFIDDTGATTHWRHSGGVAGFTADMAVFPDTGIAIIYLQNADYGYPGESLNWAYSELGGWQYDFQPVPPLNDAAGTYVDPLALGTVNITGSGETLQAEFVNQGITRTLEVIDEDTAVYLDEDLGFEVNLVFWRDSSGAIDLLSTWDGVASRQ